jgi:hypothetical protein
MPLPDIFQKQVCDEILERISSLQPDSKPLWGKMSADQMLAHCCVSYEYVYDNMHPRPNALVRWMLGKFVKPSVVSEKPYQHNGGTAPDFIIKGRRDFEEQKGRLIAYIQRTQSLGRAHFEGKESHSFGKLSADEWNNLFYKHLDHHLRQFGV